MITQFLSKVYMSMLLKVGMRNPYHKYTHEKQELLISSKDFIVSRHEKQELLISSKHFKTTAGKSYLLVPSDKCRIKLLHIIICENNKPFPSKVGVPELNKFVIKISEKSLLP